MGYANADDFICAGSIRSSGTVQIAEGQRLTDGTTQYSGVISDEKTGNVVFPSGNALKYLREYFDEKALVSNPNEEDPQNVKTISFDPDGGVLNENIYQTDILETIENYKP